MLLCAIKFYELTSWHSCEYSCLQLSTHCMESIDYSSMCLTLSNNSRINKKWTTRDHSCLICFFSELLPRLLDLLHLFKHVSIILHITIKHNFFRQLRNYVAIWWISTCIMARKVAITLSVIHAIIFHVNMLLKGSNTKSY